MQLHGAPDVHVVLLRELEAGNRLVDPMRVGAPAVEQLPPVHGSAEAVVVGASGAAVDGVTAWPDDVRPYAGSKVSRVVVATSGSREMASSWTRCPKPRNPAPTAKSPICA